MKKLTVCIAAVLLLAFAPIHSKASDKNPISVSSREKESAKMQIMIDRVNEINAMDKSSLSSAEKKELRAEVKTLKMDVNNHSRNNGGGTVYVSGGLIILIIVLIIIL